MELIRRFWIKASNNATNVTRISKMLISFKKTDIMINI